MVVQVNGKVRDRIEVAAGIDDADAEAWRWPPSVCRQHLDGGEPRRSIARPPEAGQRRRLTAVTESAARRVGRPPCAALIVSASSGRAGRPGGPITFVTGDDRGRVPWVELHEDARGLAAALQARGVGPATTSPSSARRPGRSSPPSRPSGCAARRSSCCRCRCASARSRSSWPRPARRIRNADVALVLVDDDLAAVPRARSPGDPPMRAAERRWPAPGRPLAGRLRPARDDPDALAILQFTSGSTADPKGVMLPHRTVCANLDAHRDAAGLDPDDDVLVSWLPLYHDMGLIGLLTLPMTTGHRPRARRAAGLPRRAARAGWSGCRDFGGTATAGPNFS